MSRLSCWLDLLVLALWLSLAAAGIFNPSLWTRLCFAALAVALLATIARRLFVGYDSDDT